MEERETAVICKSFAAFSVCGGREKSDKENGLIQFMECNPRSDEIDQTPGCMCLPWGTENETDHKMEGRMCNEWKWLETAEWFGVEPFSSIRGSVHVIGSNCGIAPFFSATSA